MKETEIFSGRIFTYQIRKEKCMQKRDREFPLSELEKDKTAIIIGFLEMKTELAMRLLELGFIYGSEITSNGKTTFGNPLMFTIHGSKLALRKDDAKNILVKIK